MEKEVNVVIQEQDLLEEGIMRNIMFAHKKMAEGIDHRNISGFIKLTRFILRKIKKFGNKDIYFFPEH